MVKLDGYLIRISRISGVCGCVVMQLDFAGVLESMHALCGAAEGGVLDFSSHLCSASVGQLLSTQTTLASSLICGMVMMDMLARSRKMQTLRAAPYD